MYDPFGDRQARRAQRQYERNMRRYYRYQNPMRGLAGAFVLIALIIAFAFNDTLGGHLFLPLLFVGLALASLFGSISTFNRNGIYGGFYGFIWLFGLALCFIIGFWPWILLPVVVSIILGALFRPIMGGLTGASPMAYQQPQQPYPQQDQAYQQGYQGASAQPHETYQEGGEQYETPQTPYHEQQQQQELPPMEQQQ
ncbi:MAG TPA: hypothetical protein VF458_21880 [Ktedonobacteraceae bacterium]